MSVVLLVGAFGCNNFDEDINVDPNNVSTVPPSYLISAAQRDLVGRILSVSGFDEFGTLYTQQLAQKTYTTLERYETVESSFTAWYADGNYNLTEVIRLNTDESTKDAALASGPNENQIAVAKILQCWSYMNITDIWGNVPFSEALKGRENFFPQYDNQRDIYVAMIQDLKDAANMMVPGDIEGDLVFGGDISKWSKFTGGLLMRIGLRVAGADEAMGRDAFAAGMAIGALESNGDNAIYTYAGDENNASPYYASFELQNRLDYAVSHVTLEKLGNLNDPRIHKYADPVEQVLGAKPDLAPQDFWDKYVASTVTVGGLTYAGQPYGYAQNIATLLGTSNVSYVGSYFKQATAPTVLMNYAEVLFNMAEGVERGWISGDAETYYNEAIAASMRYYYPAESDLATADIDAYIAQADVAYDGADWMATIHEQKWLASYLQGLNSWSEWRRTGYPVLEAAPDAIEGRDIPRRRAYPESEFQLNRENYEAAISAMGGNTTDERVWWDAGN